MDWSFTLHWQNTSCLVITFNCSQCEKTSYLKMVWSDTSAKRIDVIQSTNWIKKTSCIWKWSNVTHQRNTSSLTSLMSSSLSTNWINAANCRLLSILILYIFRRTSCLAWRVLEWTPMSRLKQWLDHQLLIYQRKSTQPRFSTFWQNIILPNYSVFQYYWPGLHWVQIHSSCKSIICLDLYGLQSCKMFSSSNIHFGGKNKLE